MIEPLERTIGLPDMVAYAGATWDWHRLHYDHEWVRSRDLDAPVVDGQMLGALMAEQLMDHFGPRAFISALSFRFRSMVFAGEAVRCEATEVARDGGSVEVEQRVLVGDRVAAEGRATVRA